MWVVPARGRPTQLLFMLRQALRLSGCRTDFVICHDTDDPALPGYRMAARRLDAEWPGRVAWAAGPRQPVTVLVNQVATSRVTAAYAAVGFLGDDHLPMPGPPGEPAWDAGLGAALAAGAAFAYGDDLHQRENLPTFVLARREVIAALGWLCLPRLVHYYFDDVWKALGAVYVPGVIAEHRHHLWGRAARDATYADAEPAFDGDGAAFRAWTEDEGPGGLAACRATVQAALAGTPWAAPGADVAGDLRAAWRDAR